MFCSNCGTELQPNQAVCSKCGTRVPFMSGRAAAPRAAVATAVATPYADFWVRLAAFIIDSLILSVVLWVAVPMAVTAALGKFPPWLGIVCTLGYFLYYAIFEASGMQATLGKKALGLKVTDLQGEQISFARALGHAFARIISNFTFLIGYFICAFTPKRQTLHDMVSGTLVVRKRFEPEEVANAGPAPSGGSMAVVVIIVAVFFGIAIIGILAAIAIPAYQDYTIRAQVTEGLNAASAYKAAVAEAYAGGTEFAGISSESLNLQAPALQYVDSLAVISGAIEIKYGNRANRLIAGKSLVLVPGADAERSVVWICGRADAPDGVEPAIDDHADYTSIENKYLPSACRGG